MNKWTWVSFRNPFSCCNSMGWRTKNSSINWWTWVRLQLSRILSRFERVRLVTSVASRWSFVHVERLTETVLCFVRNAIGDASLTVMASATCVLYPQIPAVIMWPNATAKRLLWFSTIPSCMVCWMESSRGIASSCIPSRTVNVLSTLFTRRRMTWSVRIPLWTPMRLLITLEMTRFALFFVKVLRIERALFLTWVSSFRKWSLLRCWHRRVVFCSSF